MMHTMAKRSAAHSAVSRSFSAPLEHLRTGLGWVIVRVPLDVARVWGKRGRVRVKGEINGFPFRTSLFPTREGTHFVLVNKRTQKGAQAYVGKTVRVRLELDTDERVVAIPAELKRVLSGERALLRWFQKLNYSLQKWITTWVSDAQSAEARRRRSERVAEQLLSTMEAEYELPPMINQAFARNPEARKGWDLMSPARRRGHLLAIFYYRTLESRNRRLAKMVEEAAALAEKKAHKHAVYRA
jgi:uncharacterized protein YdeI (YjbR/CyaY-like superfamily)